MWDETEEINYSTLFFLTLIGSGHIQSHTHLISTACSIIMCDDNGVVNNILNRHNNAHGKG